MKTAIVLVGALRNFTIPAQSWHVLGDADYFVVSWDKSPDSQFSEVCSNTYETLAAFPHPIKAALISNLDSFKQKYSSNHHIDINFLCMLYNWSLVKTLPNIMTYDRIFIMRPDLYIHETFSHLGAIRNMALIPDKILLNVSDDEIATDELLIAGPQSLGIFQNLFNDCLIDLGFSFTKVVEHKFLYSSMTKYPELIKSNVFTNVIIGTICRSGYNKAWEVESNTIKTFYRLLNYSYKWWNINNPKNQIDAEFRRTQVESLMNAVGNFI